MIQEMIQNTRPAFDELLLTIADYVHSTKISSDLALKTAYRSLLDSVACTLLALKEPACNRLLGPVVPDTIVPLGSRVLGTSFELDPILAAFNMGTCIRWLDYNDTWLAAEWGHPSDNLGGILAVADYVSRVAEEKKKNSLTLQEILIAMIKAYEIQGVLALDHAFNRVGLDHVFLVKCATTAVVSKLWGLNFDQTIDALSQVWVDGASLRTYRHAPNTGSRKSWAAGDATSRGVRLVWMVKQGEPGIPSAITAKQWGFSDVLFKGLSIQLSRPLGSYVMENILFKVAFPAEFHAQTAVECAIELYPQVKDKWDLIDKIEVYTQEPGMRIIHKEGPLYNYADRDHCLQYMIAIGLLFGNLKAEHYSDEVACDPRIDNLRSKMQVREDKTFSKDYLDPEKRAIPNAIQIFFKDNSKTARITKEYPLGHKRRRAEAEPYLKEKYNQAIQGYFKEEKKISRLQSDWDNFETVCSLPVSKWITQWC